MTRRSVLVLTTAALAAATAVGATPTAVATPSPRVASVQADPVFTVRSVALSRRSIAVSGLNTIPVTVTVRGGWTADAEWARTHLTVRMTRVAGRRPNDSAPVDRWITVGLTSGTERDGVFTAVTRVPSTMNGTFAVTGLWPEAPAPGQDFSTEQIRLTGPTLQVRGTHIPWLAGFSTSPTPLPLGTAPYRFTGRVIDMTTGRGYRATVPVRIGMDSVCVEGVPSEPATAVRGTGVWSIARRGDQRQWLHCAALVPSGATQPGEHIAIRGFAPAQRAEISVRPASTSVRVGRSTPVNGTLKGLTQVPVQLQRRYRDGRWRTVGTTRVTPRGRFVLTAQPPTRGTHRYRVLMPAYYQWVAVTSPEFVVRAR